MQPLLEHLKDKTHVIWDWNGTLLSDLQLAVRTVNRLLKEENRPAISIEDYKKVFGFPVIDYYSKLGLNTDPEYFLNLCDRYNTYFYSSLHECDLHPGVRETLREIKGAGKAQSILSASEQKALENSLQLFQITNLFDHVFGIFDKTAASKVARGQELMRTSKVAPEKTILIGDTDHDLEVGEAMGIDVILVDHGHQCPLRLREIHHTVVKVLG